VLIPFSVIDERLQQLLTQDPERIKERFNLEADMKRLEIAAEDFKKVYEMMMANGECFDDADEPMDGIEGEI
jgi:hypothetical protein